MNFKPNFQLENDIITEVLHNPNDVELIEIDTKWFNVTNFQHVLTAIQADPNANDYITWYTVAKQQGYTEEFSTFQKLFYGFVTDANLKQQVTTLKKEYLNNKFSEAIQESYKNPSEATQQKAIDILNAKRAIGAKNDGGEVESTGDELLKSFDYPKDKGIQPLDFDKFNALNNGGIKAPKLIIGGARPGVGKTSFAINLIKNIMRNPDQNILINMFTLEMDKSEIYERLVASLTGIKHRALTYPHERLNDGRIKNYVKKAVEFINKGNLKIYDNTNDLQDIINIMKQNASQVKKNHYIAIVDYIGIINADDTLPRYLQLGHVTRDLKQFARRYESPVVGLSQIKRDIENRDDKMPKLSDLRESGSIEQDADSVFFISRDEQATANESDGINILNLNFEKNRDGMLGHYHIAFNGAKMKMKELDEKNDDKDE